MPNIFDSKRVSLELFTRIQSLHVRAPLRTGDICSKSAIFSHATTLESTLLSHADIYHKRFRYQRQIRACSIETRTNTSPFEHTRAFERQTGTCLRDMRLLDLADM